MKTTYLIRVSTFMVHLASKAAALYVFWTVSRMAIGYTAMPSFFEDMLASIPTSLPFPLWLIALALYRVVFAAVFIGIGFMVLDRIEAYAIKSVRRLLSAERGAIQF